ncbi:hypothetical protein TCON_2085 [Astathelohania contejeani]|uniref:Uncharacterized protein n=1 Tax=Astathelohania contejeani TaxID=164912 RepID=A0ABQ7HWZ7_9MICR|nr:hypothetical protein TCON_2085 [Thelohania contejeani]
MKKHEFESIRSYENSFGLDPIIPDQCPSTIKCFIDKFIPLYNNRIKHNENIQESDIINEILSSEKLKKVINSIKPEVLYENFKLVDNNSDNLALIYNQLVLNIKNDMINALNINSDLKCQYHLLYSKMLFYAYFSKNIIYLIGDNISESNYDLSYFSSEIIKYYQFYSWMNKNLKILKYQVEINDESIRLAIQSKN